MIKKIIKGINVVFVTPNRVYWIISFLLVVCLCGVLIQKYWIDWNERPVVLAFAEQLTPISAIPFPAITMCLEIKSSKHNLDYSGIFNTVHEARSRHIPFPYGLSKET